MPVYERTYTDRERSVYACTCMHASGQADRQTDRQTDRQLSDYLVAEVCLLAPLSSCGIIYPIIDSYCLGAVPNPEVSEGPEVGTCG